MALAGASNLTAPFPTPKSQFKKLQNKPRIFAIHSLEKSNSSNPLKVSSNWNLDSWKTKKALQIPAYNDKQELEDVLKQLERFPPLVFAGEARKLEERLADAAVGKAFLLQGGDCAESFKEFGANNIRDTGGFLLQMGVVLTFGAQMPIIKVGRMAGQFAKPRSDPFETKDGVTLPSYQGDNINSDAFDEKSMQTRIPEAFNKLFAVGGYAAIQRVTKWNLDFVENSEQGDKYKELAQRVDEALGFMAAAGLTVDHPIMTTTEFYTSHECLHLPYEQSLTREDSTMDGGLFYDCSAHMLWVGERTRQLDGAHVEFLRGVANPLGIKVSDKMDPAELVKLCEILSPHNRPGRLTIIVRMGADKMRAELRAFFDVHDQEGSYPGGVHLEMTGQNVTECVGGSKNVTFDDLESRYHTHCDPG
ncbi:hypothetical protein MKW92_046439 [Papaver armeniacum]|nr:hypothetical protein MKW92_046439 [Papaver armeniacum]